MLIKNGIRSMIKYPRTLHLPFSPGVNKDDRRFNNLSCFKGKRVVVLEKMDGENTTMTSSTLYARSPSGSSHDSQSWVRGLHGRIKHTIPIGYRICGENLYAKHSIYYKDLTSYFQVFSIWDDNEESMCLPLEDTLHWCEELHLIHTPVLIQPHVFNEELLKELATKLNTDTTEGFVIRNIDSFSHKDFYLNVAKYVRANHVSSDEHWKLNWRKNGLK